MSHDFIISDGDRARWEYQTARIRKAREERNAMNLFDLADNIVSIYEADDEDFERPEERGELAFGLMRDLTPGELQLMVTHLAGRVAEFS
jgi:hypothetical protein